MARARGISVDAGGNAVGDEVEQELFLTRRRILQQFDHVGGLLRGQRQGRNAQGGALGDVLAVCIKHEETPGVLNGLLARRLQKQADQAEGTISLSPLKYCR